MNYLTYSQIVFANWHTLDAQDRARAKFNLRAWIAEARADRIGQ